MIMLTFWNRTKFLPVIDKEINSRCMPIGDISPAVPYFFTLLHLSSVSLMNKVFRGEGRTFHLSFTLRFGMNMLIAK